MGGRTNQVCPFPSKYTNQHKQINLKFNEILKLALGVLAKRCVYLFVCTCVRGNNKLDTCQMRNAIMVYSGKENGHHGALGGQLWSKTTRPPVSACALVCVFIEM